MDMSSSSALRPLRRRNGRPQACEPCRLRKVACDHQFPICGRCRRGNIQHKCVYHVQGPVAAREMPLSPARSSGTGDASARQSPANQAGTPATVRSEVHALPGPERDAGFLGATSFSAMFKETQDSLSMLQRPSVSVETHEPLTNGEPQVVLEIPVAPENISLHKELEVLRIVPTKGECDLLRSQDERIHHSWCRAALHRLHDSLWDTFGAHLSGRHGIAGLKEMGQILSRNSAIPLAENHEDPEDWFQAFAGMNMRWESMGVLFSYWTNAVMVLSADSTSKVQEKLMKDGKRNAMLKYKNGLWSCAELCRSSGNRNSLLVYMLYKHSLLQSMVSGDASWEYWRLHAEVISFTTFLGFHEATKPSYSDRNISTQMQRRVFARIFTTDKLIAAFNGRPPLISRNYLSVALPLDISDEFLLSKDFTNPAVDLRIDENGWNIDNQMYPTTVLRARAMLGFIRDAILEFALQDTSVSDHPTLLNLLEREMRTVSQFPPILLLKDGDIKCHDIDGYVLFTRLLVRLEHLQNLFFIERLVSKQKNTVSPQLLELSLEMVTLTVAFWTQQDRLSCIAGDFEFLVMSYAAPAGGILCTELLNPSSSRGATTPPVTRSNIIQQLSLLYGFLDWVGPTAPNGDLCSSVKQVIKHVLDEALNVSADAPGLMDEVGNWDMGFSADLNEYFSFDLLDTFDWLPNRA